MIGVAVREDEGVEPPDAGNPKRRRNDAVADVEAGTARHEAAGIDEQRAAARKPDERCVALPHVEKRHVQPAVAARERGERPGLRHDPDGSAARQWSAARASAGGNQAAASAT